jgi:hypothetical protein
MLTTSNEKARSGRFSFVEAMRCVVEADNDPDSRLNRNWANQWAIFDGEKRLLANCDRNFKVIFRDYLCCVTVANNSIGKMLSRAYAKSTAAAVTRMAELAAFVLPRVLFPWLAHGRALFASCADSLLTFSLRLGVRAGSCGGHLRQEPSLPSCEAAERLAAPQVCAPLLRAACSVVAVRIHANPRPRERNPQLRQISVPLLFSLVLLRTQLRG